MAKALRGAAPAVWVQIPGEPVAQQRPRWGRTHVYEPRKSREWKEYARVVMAEAVNRGGVRSVPQGPVQVTIRACHELRKSYHRERFPVGEKWRDKKPDIDNVAKIVLDAASEILFGDDKQVCRLVVEQLTGAQGTEPFVTIEVMELTDAV